MTNHLKSLEADTLAVVAGTTPGPWKAVGRGIFADDGTHIATATHPRDVEDHPDGKYPDYDTSITHAGLMALAPELLAALQNLIEKWGQDGDPFWDVARACVSKAMELKP